MLWSSPCILRCYCGHSTFLTVTHSSAAASAFLSLRGLSLSPCSPLACLSQVGRSVTEPALRLPVGTLEQPIATDLGTACSCWRGLEEDTPHLPVASGREHRNVLWLKGAETSWHLLTASHFLSQPAARPPVPAHQVPPYKAVSARLRPFTFSQSTPIGLDRVGRRRQMKTSNGESWGFMESFVWDQGAEAPGDSALFPSCGQGSAAVVIWVTLDLRLLSSLHLY